MVRGLLKSSLATVFVCSTIFVGCNGSQFVGGESPSSETNPAPNLDTEESFSDLYEKQLIEEGMSAENAAYIVEQVESSSSSGFAQKLISFSTNEEDISAVSADAAKKSFKALSSYNHFGSDSEKKQALQVIVKAIVGTVEKKAQDVSEMSSAIESSSEAMTNVLDEIGLSGDSMNQGVKDIGAAIISGLEKTDLSQESYSGIVNSFSRGSMSGILKNPAIASSAAEFLAAINEGAIQQLGGATNSSLTTATKGQIIKDFILGVKQGLDNASEMSQGNRDSVLTEICNRAQEVVVEGDPSLNGHIYDAISIVKEEPVLPPSGSIVKAAGSVSCLFSFITGGSAGAPSIESAAQCRSYCESIGNNNYTRAGSCFADGQVIKEFTIPRAQVYSDMNAPMVCVARISVGDISYDYAPQIPVNLTACRQHCDSVLDVTGTKKCLVGYGSSKYVLFDYSANKYVPPSETSTVVAPSCKMTYDQALPSSVNPIGSGCGGPGLTNVLGGAANSSGAKFHSIDMYETSSNLHGGVILSSSPLLVQNYRVVGETEINISAGSEPIYLVLKSYEPTKYKITGEIGRIVKVYVLGYHCHSVEGVDSSKVVVNTFGQDASNELSVLKSMSGSSSYSNPLVLADLAKSSIPALASIPLGTAQGSYSSACHEKKFIIP